METEIILDSLVRERIEAVSSAWKKLLIGASMDEIRQRVIYPGYKNAIVSAINDNEQMQQLSDAVNKLFELTW